MLYGTERNGKIMFVKQISVFVENKSGKLVEIIGILAKSNIDISALSIADTTDFGILRLIVNDPEKAKAALREHGMVVKTTNVIALAIPDEPGGLVGALDVLKENGVAIEYMYAFVGKSDKGAMVILKTDDPDTAVKALEKAGSFVVDAKDVYRL